MHRRLKFHFDDVLTRQAARGHKKPWYKGRLRKRIKPVKRTILKSSFITGIWCRYCYYCSKDSISICGAAHFINYCLWFIWDDHINDKICSITMWSYQSQAAIPPPPPPPPRKKNPQKTKQKQTNKDNKQTIQANKQTKKCVAIIIFYQESFRNSLI